MRKHQIEEEIFQLKIIFSYYPPFRTFDHRYKLLRGRFTCTKQERCASHRTFPHLYFPISTPKLRINSPFSPAYNTAHGPWHNHNLILQATHQSGGFGSFGFPACETNWVSSYKQPNSHSCDHLHVSELEILLLDTE